MKAGERGRACWDKELGTQGWAPSTGSPVRRKTSVLQEEEGAGGTGSQPQPPGPGVPPVGAVGVWKAAGGRGTLAEGKLERGQKGLMQPVVASLKFSVKAATSSGFTCALA